MQIQILYFIISMPEIQDYVVITKEDKEVENNNSFMISGYVIS